MVRCTECSRPVRPVVAVDVDGTLGDYHHHLQHFGEQYLGHKLKDGYDGSMKLREWWGIDVTTYRQLKLAYRQGGMKRSMPIFGGADHFMQLLRNKAEVWITTTRPYLRLDNVDPDTRFWLDRHGIRFDGLLYDEDKYERLAELVDPGRVVAVLDDLPEMYDAAARKFGAGVPILRRQKANRTIIRDNMVFDFDHAFREIHARITKWKDDREHERTE